MYCTKVDCVFTLGKIKGAHQENKYIQTQWLLYGSPKIDAWLIHCQFGMFDVESKDN